MLAFPCALVALTRRLVALALRLGAMLVGAPPRRLGVLRRTLLRAPFGHPRVFRGGERVPAEAATVRPAGAAGPTSAAQHRRGRKIRLLERL